MLVRQNCDYIILKKVNSKKDFSRIMAEYNLSEMSEADLIKLYKEITSKDFTHFLLLDLIANNPNLKYRHNFDGVAITDKN